MPPGYRVAFASDEGLCMTASPQRATPRDWLGLAVIALPCIVYAMDLTVLNLAVPAISRELRPTAAQLLWIIDIYGFMVAGMLITMGTLGDRIGRRKLLMFGAAAFGAASVLAAFATTPLMLIAMRAVLGIAGATLAPSTLSLIRNMFHDPAQRRIAIGVWVASFSVGGAIGPVVGGLLLEFYWWGAVFLLAVPVMLLMLVLGPFLLPEYRDPRPGALDIASAVLSLCAVMTTIWGIKKIAEEGIDLAPLAMIGVGVALAVAFVRRQRTLARPMIDLRLFDDRAFTSALLAYALGTFVAFGVFVFVAQYLQLVLGMDTLEAGLWSMPFALGFIVGASVTPRLAERFGPAPVITGGLAVAALGFVALAVFAAHGSPGAIVGAFTLYAVGLAPVFTLATDLVVGCAPPEHAGAASALSETGSELGGALGIALLGSLGAAIYRLALSDTAFVGIAPADLAEARNTLGAALDIAARTAPPTGALLADAAREAFVRGMQAGAVAASVVMALLAALTAGPLRGAREARSEAVDAA